MTRGDFAAAWAAQEQATAEYADIGQGGGSKVVAVAVLTDKIAAAELQARQAAYKEEGDAAYKRAAECVEKLDVEAAKEALKVCVCVCVCVCVRV